MAAIPQRLKTGADNVEHRQRTDPRSEDVRKRALESGDEGTEIPIFCAGGCGEVMGFVKKGQSIPTYRCLACQATETAKASLPATEFILRNTDELAELRSAPRDLRLVHIAQVVAVALIFAGSVCIATGRPLGIYLAAIGTLAWVTVAVARWRMRD